MDFGATDQTRGANLPGCNHRLCCQYVSRLESEPRLVSQIGSGVLVGTLKRRERKTRERKTRHQSAGVEMVRTEKSGNKEP